MGETGGRDSRSYRYPLPVMVNNCQRETVLSLMSRADERWRDDESGCAACESSVFLLGNGGDSEL